MPFTEIEIQERIAGLCAKCAEAGIRVTRQRLEVFREVARTTAHPDAETVWSRVRERLPRLSLDTVYRTLAGLEDLGLLARLAVPGRTAARFDANPRPHYHFVCTRCGLIRDFASNHLDSFAVPAELAAWGRVETLRAEAHGLCRDCLKSHPVKLAVSRPPRRRQAVFKRSARGQV